MPEQLRPDLALFEVIKNDAVDMPPQHLGEMVLSQVQRQWPEIVARVHQHIKGVELHFVIKLPAVEAIEVGDAVDAEQHGFAVQGEGVGPVAQRGLDNARVPVAPVIAVAGPQPYGLALPLNDQAVAIVFDLMKPLRPVEDLGPARRNAGANAGLRIRDK